MSIFIVINKTSTKTDSSGTPSGVPFSLDRRQHAVTPRGSIVKMEVHEAIPRNGRVESNKKSCIQLLIISNVILIPVLLYFLSVDTNLRHTNTQSESFMSCWCLGFLFILRFIRRHTTLEVRPLRTPYLNSVPATRIHHHS